MIDAIKKMKETGVAFVPGALSAELCRAVAAEARMLPFRRAEEFVGSVRQRFEYCAFLREATGYPELDALRRSTQTLVHDAGIPEWSALEIAVNRYAADGEISAHRDFERHEHVIAIWNVAGSCTFEVLGGREGPVLTAYRLEPRDLVLLRGPSPRDHPSEDPRPFHRVRGVAEGEPRISVTVRDNTKPGVLIKGFSYTNA